MKWNSKSGVVAVLLASVSLAACGSKDPNAPESATPPATQPSYSPTVKTQSQPKVTQRVGMQGARVAAYGAESLDEFARSSFVSKVVIGRVISTESRVYSPKEDDVVYTEVTIEPDNAPGTVVRMRELGGIVRMSQVAGSLSGHVSEEELARRGDELVEYTNVDFPVHSAVGDRVLALLGGQPSGLGYFSAAALVQDDSGAFVWPSKAPNDAWEHSVSATQAERMAGYVK